MIHESVIIEDGAQIGENVKIGPFCHISSNSIISDGCTLESNVILNGKVTLDKEVKLFSFVTLGWEDSEITVGEKTHIREFCQIGSQEPEDGVPKQIKIGANNFLMAYVQIASGVELGDFCILTNAVKLYENVSCADRVIIGGLSTVEANNKLGTGVMIGGASYVNHDMPPFTLIEGNNATIKGLNIVGLRRRIENKDDIQEIKTIFKEVFRSDGEVDKDLAAKIADQHANGYVKTFAAFIAQSNI
jgi:UDP-N-acetylglucosamine acyltransferase